jgi:Domain of unknown function (DUF5666)
MSELAMLVQSARLSLRRYLLALGAVALTLAACGGGSGGNVATVGTGGTGAFSVGAITGFGSVIVNGVRFDDSSPSLSVSDDEGPRSLGDLRLGMVVKVEGSTSTSGSASATASSIVFDSELLGPANVTNTSPKAITVIGQKVLTSNATVFDASLPAGMDSIQSGDVLEVHGFLNPVFNELQATFIERKTGLPTKYKISGNVSKLSSGSKTFQIGNETISFASLSGSNLPSNLADDLAVKVRLAPPAPNASGIWTATRVRQNKDALPDKEEAEVEGVVTAFTSTSTFSVGNVVVNAANASFRDGSANVFLGARVEVKGSLVGGVLVAKLVKSEDDGNEVELDGSITSVDASAKTFVLRGQTVSYGGAVQYEGGSATDLVVGRKVEVKAQTGQTSSIVNATKIKFEN